MILISLFIPVFILIMKKLTADDLIYGYMNGIFPMADMDGSLYWYAPDPRAIIPLTAYHIPHSLKSVINKSTFDVRINDNFEGVMRGCALPRSSSIETWISEEIIEAYTDLHKLGLAHSVEAYIDNRLVGGLYGVAIGGVFFGESMFHTVSNASKVAFHHLISILIEQGFELLDTQFINDNVKRFGAIEISKDEYQMLLKDALNKKAHFSDPALDHLFKNHS
jgi:leucyl/phenylalanyl-tRNA---protein transferase